jgi:hypothetical protein
VVSEKKHFETFYEIQNGGYGRTYFNIGPYGKNVSKCFFSETTWAILNFISEQKTLRL